MGGYGKTLSIFHTSSTVSVRGSSMVARSVVVVVPPLSASSSSPFLLFLLLPQANGVHPAGWVVYAVYILVTFSILKWYNYCLHKALGSDPEPEPEPEENITDDEHEEAESREKSGDESEDRRIEFDPPPQSRETTSGQRDKEEEEEEDEDSEEGEVQADLRDRLAVVDSEEVLKQHRSSASTLNDLTNSSNQLTSDIELSEVLPFDPISSIPLPSSSEVKLNHTCIVCLPFRPGMCWHFPMPA